MSEPDAILVERDGPVTIVSINRPHCRNAVDGATARKLYDAFLAFDADADASVAVFTGTGGTFCAGADLKAVARGDREKKREVGGHDSIAPMGPSRLRLSKPVIAAVEGFAVAGGMELALWADMRVVAEDATFGIFCRRFGVPLIDLGTIRLPRLIGHSQAIDLILTGRPVGGTEALQMGLANRLVPKGWRTTSPGSHKCACAQIDCRRCGNGIFRRRRRSRPRCAAGLRSSPPARRWRERRASHPALAVMAPSTAAATARALQAPLSMELLRPFDNMVSARAPVRYDLRRGICRRD
jgi:enoyl-CoA hydratase